MLLSEYLDLEDLEDCINEGYISVRDHHELPLQILNYTPKGTYSFSPEEWPDAMIKCRGLIINKDTDEIVAFCQPKFWNLDPENHNETGEFYAYDKLDGSLGIVFEYDGLIHVATRGSFHSDQAEWATQFLRDPKNVNYVHWFEDKIVGLGTPHVEIIYPENKIVLDYEYSDLVLLGFQDGICGWMVPEDPDYNTYPGRVAEEFFAENLSDLDFERDNKEGFVIFYLESANKYKIKHEHYIELHRAIFNLTDRRIWEQVYAGTHKEFIANMPNEFQKEIAEKSDYFVIEALSIQAQCIDIYFRWIEQNPDKNRKDFAVEFKDHPLKYFLFMYWDRKSAEEIFKKTLYSIRP